MSHEIKLKAYIYRYCATAAAVKAEDPSYVLFNYQTNSSDWTFVKEIEVVEVDTTTNDEMVQEAVATIDKAIHERRMELERDLAELVERKKDLLALAYDV